MTSETCEELNALVRRLGEAINRRKHTESDREASAEDRVQTLEDLNRALEEVRAHKAGHQCSGSPEEDNRLPAAG